MTGFEIANYWYIKGLEVKFIRETGEGTINLIKIPENKLLDDVNKIKIFSLHKLISSY